MATIFTIQVYDWYLGLGDIKIENSPVEVTYKPILTEPDGEGPQTPEVEGSIFTLTGTIPDLNSFLEDWSSEFYERLTGARKYGTYSLPEDKVDAFWAEIQMLKVLALQIQNIEIFDQLQSWSSNLN